MSDSARVPHGWEGNQDGVTRVGDGITEALNFSFYYEGELRRRPALGTRYVLSATLLGAIEHPIQGSFLLASAQAAGTITGYKPSDASTASVSSGLNTSNRGCFAYNNGAAYYTNDYDAAQVIRTGSTSSNAAGITGPVAAPVFASLVGGLVPLGIHLVRYRYKDSRTGYVSNASPALSYNNVSGVPIQITFTTVASTDAKVDQIVLEATLVNGSTFYVAATSTNTTSAVYNLSDATLAQQVGASFTDGDQLGAGHEPPPLSTMLVEHRARLFAWGASVISGAVILTNGSAVVPYVGAPSGWAGRLIQFLSNGTNYTIQSVGATTFTISAVWPGSSASTAFQVFSGRPDLLYWSRAGYPESWKPAAWARRVLQGTSDLPSAIASLYGDLYLIGRRSMRRLVITDDPAAGMLVSVPTTLGAWNNRCVVNANGQLFGWGRGGAWTISGILPKHISRDIDDTVTGLYDISKSEQFFGFFDPNERCVWWMYVRSGESTPRDAICYDVERQQWTPRKFRNALADGLTMGDTANFTKVYLADAASSSTWTLDMGRLFDGVPSTLTTGAVTVAAGSTTTVINTSETYSANTLIGCFLSNFTTSEDFRITGNGANSITVTTGFAGAPSAGTILYLGSILCRLTSDWWPGTDLSYRKRPAYFVAEQANAEAVVCSVTINRDFSATPVTLTNYGTGFDPQPSGVTFTSGATTMTGDLSTIGTYFPLPSDWSKCLRFKLVQQIPFGTVQLLDARFEDKDPRNEEPKAVTP